MTLMILMKRNMDTMSVKTRAAKLIMKLKKNPNNELIKTLFIYIYVV